EQGQAKQLSLTTPILSTSSVMRRDLWANTELLKQHAGFSCAQSQIAQAEVMLVWAAAEHCELGWRHSRELFLSAQRLIDQANSRAFSCSADVPQQLPKISYPSLQELNGSEQGCHGVV
ncbi:OmpA family protein, partial [Acinetobacter baumannii]